MVNATESEGVGTVIYPGIRQIVSASYSRSHGISPDVCTIEMAPQTLDPKDPDYSKIEPDGYLIFQFDTTTVTTDANNIKTTKKDQVQILMQGCRPAKASVKRSASSKTWTIPVYDRRWKWKFGSFSGHWNIKKNGVIEKRKEKTARELADMCLDAMGEKNYETKALDELEKKKNLPYRKRVRPEVHWDRIAPAQALNDLVTKLGYRVCLGWDEVVRIEKYGEGEFLPEDESLMNGGFEANLPETPDSVTVLGGISMHEVLWHLEEVGLDIDGEWRPIYHLSYTPLNDQKTPDWRVAFPGEFFVIKDHFDDIKFNKKPSDAEYKKRKDQYSLAVQTVYRCYRMTYPVGTKEDKAARSDYDQLGALVAKSVNEGKRRGDRDHDKLMEKYEKSRRDLFLKSKPVLPGPKQINPKTGKEEDLVLEEFEQVLPTFGTRAELAIDSYTSKLIRQPAEVSGIFYDENKVFNKEDPSEKLDTVDATKVEVLKELGIIKFSEPMYQYKKTKVYIKGKKAEQELPFPADLRVKIATPLKDLVGEPVRYKHVEELDQKYKTKPAKLPSGIKGKPAKLAAGTETKVVIKNEIVHAYQAKYETTKKNGKYETNLDSVVDNAITEELEKQALAAIDVENIKIFTKDSGSGVYAGLKKLNLDGAIQQVAITRTRSGMTTTIARNSEVELYVPDFDERQRNIALKEMIETHKNTVDNTQPIEAEKPDV